MRYELAIFDLDGTLLNTLSDLADAANAALKECGYPARSMEEVRTFIGNGVARLIARAVPQGTSDDAVASVLARFKAIYIQNVNVKTAPYPGVMEMLETLNRRGVRCAVNSNKVDGAVRLLCDDHFAGLLSMALGEREGIPKKPAPDGARLIMQALGVAPEKTLYVGDGDADLLTAKNAGIDCAWVSWGYRSRAELSGLDITHAFDSAARLTDFILSE